MVFISGTVSCAATVELPIGNQDCRVATVGLVIGPDIIHWRRKNDAPGNQYRVLSRVPSDHVAADSQMS